MVDLHNLTKPVDKTGEILSQPQVIGSVAAAHIQSFTRFAILGIQGCFILNASVGIAAFSQKATSVFPIWLCAFGAMLSIVASYKAYMAQYNFSRADMFMLRSYMDEINRTKYVEEAECAERTATNYVGNCTFCCSYSLIFFILALISI